MLARRDGKEVVEALAIATDLEECVSREMIVGVAVRPFPRTSPFESPRLEQDPSHVIHAEKSRESLA